MGNEINNSLTKKKEANLSELKVQLNKLCFFCKRTLTKKINAFHRPMIFWELITYLMAIGHGYFYLNNYLKKNIKTGKYVLEYLETANKYFDNLYRAFYDKDESLIAKMNKEKTRIVFHLPEKLMEQKKDNPVVISKIQYIARITGLCSGSVFFAIISKT